ncbi:nucleotidyltransferase domain-containing protein [Marivirga sp. S37H4]|uniref:Nucleotidyltransferase domain-containing protein n=1 Tax=Marivirga aurantiaca TaxID=2802615 RepID=A0A935C9B8_9BACT|nr:nucleotidyltransferase domain-containing protein [Marivirga aurantiaca]MBK6266081.1 nucleotidyltransferase domain-containing protein [Marivirga aurantiaca]
MEDKIKKYLIDLEKENGIEILLACETGSRAWGFPSPDSDFDVRIIYKHHKDWYLSLTEEKDTIECFYENNDIDISGWDLRKSLRLIWKSNPPLLERIQSPIIYHADEDFLAGINSIVQKTYSRIATIHHYLSMAKKALDEVVNSNDYKLKRFFYALRASVACLWILEKEEIPPIEFGKMVNGLDLSDNLTNRINELIELKSTISETYLHNGEQDLIKFMESCLERANNESKSLPASKGQISELNEFFRNTLD